jgi:hypothetical protein
MRRGVMLLAMVVSASAPFRSSVRVVRAGDELQAALNAARSGDEIRLEAGATFTGNFLLPLFDGETPVTLRTNLPDDQLPPPNQRVTPASAARFARVVSANSSPALRTAPGAHGWHIGFVEFPANKDGFGDILQIGDGSPAQSQPAQVPFDIVLDHLYVHGDPQTGQKRGIALNGRSVTVSNCHVSDIKAVGADAQAIAGWNGPGPFTIENNYLEASGEVFLLGGADPSIPDLVSADVIVRFNQMSRPMSWRQPIVAAPTGAAAAAEAHGTLPAGTYTYRIAARRPSGQGSTATSEASAEVSVTSPGGAVAITWTPVPGAADYVVYGRTPGVPLQSWTVTAPHFTDSGVAGTPGIVPKEATRWQIKNVLELKNARRVTVDSNLIENNWQAAQPGYAVLFTPRNQGGACPWCVVESVAFTHNVVRNVAAAVNLLGHDSPNPSRQTNAIRIEDNLFDAITTRMGGNGWGVLLGDGPRDITIARNTFVFDGTTLLYAYGAPKIEGFTFTANAAPHGQYGINGAGASTGTLALQTFFIAPRVTNNWLGGGPNGRYPPGNRFDVPFDPERTGEAGTDYQRMRALADAVVEGLEVTSSTR